MTAPLLIHVGWHKTATTWLQKHVFDPGRLGFFPVDPEGRSSMAFGWEFLCGRGERPDWGGRLASPFDFDAVETHARLARLRAGGPSGGVAVISHEDLCGHMMSGGIAAKEIAERLHAVAPDARILVTIREQTGLIHSSYSHFLRAGGICGLRRYLILHNEYQTPFFDPSHLRFDRVVAHYRALFGNDAVMVLPYEHFRTDPAWALSGIATFAGACGEGVGELPAERRVNAEDERVDALNRLFPLLNLLGDANNLNARAAFGSNRLKRRATRAAAFAVPPAVARRYLARQRKRIPEILGRDFFATSNAKLEAMTGLDLGALGYVVT